MFTSLDRPAGDFGGGDRPHGVVLTYELPYAVRHVTLEVVGSQHVIRRLSGKGRGERSALEIGGNW